MGCMLTRVRRQGRSHRWLFRATVAIACGHSQVLQYLKWFHNTWGENAEIEMQGNLRGEAAYPEGRSPLGHWCLVCPPDPGWSLLPCPAWRSPGPQRGIALPAWCCMAEVCRPGRGWAHPWHLPWIGPMQLAFPPWGGSRIQEQGQAGE